MNFKKFQDRLEQNEQQVFFTDINNQQKIFQNFKK